MLVEQLSAGLERIIGMAMIDEEFGRSLLEWPVQTASGLGLTLAEIEVLRSVQGRTVPELAGALLERHRGDLNRGVRQKRDGAEVTGPGRHHEVSRRRSTLRAAWL